MSSSGQPRSLALIKRLPIDLGQGTFRHTTRSKQIAFAAAGSGRGRPALDFGCGDGFWSRRLGEAGWQVTSADVRPRFPGSIAADGERALPFADRSFDLVWMAEVLEHVQNVTGLLRECRRVLKPGGRLILTTPNSAFWLYSLVKLGGITAAHIQNPDHKHFFSATDIKRLFPTAAIYGFFPYNVIKLRITRGVGLLSPSFIVVETAARSVAGAPGAVS